VADDVEALKAQNTALIARVENAIRPDGQRLT
jgi:hypothetical protein